MISLRDLAWSQRLAQLRHSFQMPLVVASETQDEVSRFESGPVGKNRSKHASNVHHAHAFRSA
jgi:hypothetical protein